MARNSRTYRKRDKNQVFEGKADKKIRSNRGQKRRQKDLVRKIDFTNIDKIEEELDVIEDEY